MKKRGQIWVETVIYTLIALTMIGLVLTFVKPKIEEFQDETVITQSIDILKKIDSTINEIRIGGSGNQRKVEVNIQKGNLKIDGINDKLIFDIESKCQYSESGEGYQEGNIEVLTISRGEINLVNITRDYSGDYNITYRGKDEEKSLTKAAVSYNLLISNEGEVGGKTEINVEII
jgi:hypothetical protein